MTQLAELIRVSHRNVRAVNVEEDFAAVDVLDGYSPGAHVLDAVRRITVGLQSGARTRAWSVTGPYGAGKSSFALFLAALLAADADPRRNQAAKLLRRADPQLAATLDRERKRLSLGPSGAIAALGVAAREPTVTALLRALGHGAQAYFGGSRTKPKVVRTIAAAVSEADTDPAVLLNAVDELAAVAPVLLAVDELGKTLEFAADRIGEGDLFVLQQLAERFSSAERLNGMVVTLQHLAFEDYLVGAGDARRREWRKVHGRFDDLPFVGDSHHSWRLTADALERLRPRAAEWSKVSRAAAAARDAVATAAPHLPDPAAPGDSPDALYPLHPLAALALPALTARLGQHDRSLVAFLAGDAPHALPAFLQRARIDGGSVTFLRLTDLYDYFFQDGAHAALTGPEGALAREISSRVEASRDHDELAVAALKSVGLLNLAGGAHGLLAAPDVLVEALVGPDDTAERREAVEAALDGLVERSLVTYRSFAGEYRVWEGSDFDIVGETAAARDRLTAHADADALVRDVVRRIHPLRAPVAQRHSQRRHLLRYFEARFAGADVIADATVELPGADGLVLWVLAPKKAPKELPATTADGAPLVVVWSPFAREVRELAFDLEAATSVLEGAPELSTDVVAKRELRHRVAVLQSALIDTVDQAFSGERKGVCWFSAGARQPAAGAAGLSQLLSEICERRFGKTPVIRNEMVNRRDLTSQGAKARRMLLERMFVAPDEACLGIEGYGPERAMYEAVLRDPGLHVAIDDGSWAFAPPAEGSELQATWQAIMAFFDQAVTEPRSVGDLYLELLSPPFGLKGGPIPVLLASALQYRSEDVFLYQDGSFEPIVDAALIERLLKAPERFAVKRAALLGLRGEIFDELRELFGRSTPAAAATRNASTLAVVRPLISFVNGLPEYARQTESISDRARAVCRVLQDAREPDELLFRELPIACGIEPIGRRLKPTSEQREVAREFVRLLRAALAELGAAYEALLDRVADLLRHSFGRGVARNRLREDLRVRALHLEQHVIEPKLRAFLLRAADEGLDEPDWLENLAMTLGEKPPSSWTDHDVALFEAMAAERAGWFRRLEALYFEQGTINEKGFEARRLTLTAPNGVEQHELVPVDQQTQELVADVLDSALLELEVRLSSASQASKALLGVLASRVLSDPASFAASAAQDAAPRSRKVRSA